jgi:hypothetical protein
LGAVTITLSIGGLAMGGLGGAVWAEADRISPDARIADRMAFITRSLIALILGSLAQPRPPCSGRAVFY